MSPVPAAPSAAPLFDRGGWWDPACREFASLRSVTRFRLELLRGWLPRPPAGLDVVDLGCGGGLLSVPLAREGASVVAVDLARQALAAGRAQPAPPWCAVVGDLAAVPVADRSADLVLLADVLEHVASPAAVVREATRLLRPGGHLFVNTIHRTRRSRWLAIVLGEGLGFIPRGTHEWHLFITPEELDAMAVAHGLQRRRRTGEAPRLWATLRQGAVVLRESGSLAVGYAVLYRKEA
jgi:2-polyprenyl-6-hydroxyphenyl methylase/3-demethylubiquinone-9 3-methyltransferase